MGLVCATLSSTVLLVSTKGPLATLIVSVSAGSQDINRSRSSGSATALDTVLTTGLARGAANNAIEPTRIIANEVLLLMRFSVPTRQRLANLTRKNSSVS